MAVIEFHDGSSRAQLRGGTRQAQQVVFNVNVILNSVTAQIQGDASTFARAVVWSNPGLSSVVATGSLRGGGGAFFNAVTSEFSGAELRAGTVYYIGWERPGSGDILDIRSSGTQSFPHEHKAGEVAATLYPRREVGPQGSFTRMSDLALELDATLVNRPPVAPTLSHPVGGTVFDRGASQRFSWVFNDPDPGDSQSAYRVRYRATGTSAWTTSAWITSPSRHHDFPAATFGVGELEWQAATKDARGELGPWSASAFFAAGNPVTTHSITDPANGGTVPTDSYTLVWSTPEQDAYQVQVLDGEATVFDTGTVESANARSLTLDFPNNNVARSIRVRVRFGGLWSAWSTVNVTVAYTPPATPLLDLIGDDKTGSITVHVHHPDPVEPQQPVESMDVWVRESGDTTDGIRLAAGLNPNNPYTWWLPASGVEYEFRVRAYAANGTSIWSDWLAIRAPQVFANGDGTLTIREPIFPGHDIQVADNGDGTITVSPSPSQWPPLHHNQIGV